MLRERLLFACFTAFIMLLPSAICEVEKNYYCRPSSCGNIQNIIYPFRLKTDPKYCGHQSYELSCENNRTILQLYSGRYYVEEINYNDLSMRVVDAGLQKDICSSLPLYSLTSDNFSSGHPYFLNGKNAAITFINCETQVNSSFYIDTSVCNGENNSLKSSSSIGSGGFMQHRFNSLGFK